MADRIRVLLVEDQPLTRLGVRSVIENEPDIELVGETNNSTDGFRKFKELKPNVTILGLRLRNSSLSTISIIILWPEPKARIIVLGEHAGDAEITKALKKGALGYICKNVSPEELIVAIRTVAAGE